MFEIQQFTEKWADQLFSLLKEHQTIARTPLNEDLTKNLLVNKLLTPGVLTLVCVKNNNVISFLISRKFIFLPTWCVKLVCVKKSNFFNPRSNGLGALYDATIDYWERQGIFNFLYAQPSVFLNGPNDLQRRCSPRLQEYKPYNYFRVPPGQRCEYDFIRIGLLDDRIFEEEMVVRWLFKDEKQTPTQA